MYFYIVITSYVIMMCLWVSNMCICASLVISDKASHGEKPSKTAIRAWFAVIKNLSTRTVSTAKSFYNNDFIPTLR